MKQNSLFKHQIESIKFLEKRPLVFDMSDPGTGKTRVQVEDIAKRRRKKGGKTLIVAPKSLLESAWKEDFKKFAPDMYVVTCFAHNRKQALALKADVYVINIDGIKDILKQPPKWFREFDTIVIDESTAFKHHSSARSAAARKVTQKFKYRRCMSGTPMSNTVLDIWHQTYLLDEGKRLGDTFTKFRNAACECERDKDSGLVKWVDRPNMEVTIGLLLKDIAIRHKFEDCVDIPANHRYAVNFELSKKHMQVYQEMQKNKLLELKDKQIDAVNGATLYTKLLQIASGAVYDTNGDSTLIDSDRYELILDLIEAREHSIVFFNWEHQRDLLTAAADKRGFSFAVYDGKTNDRERVDIVQAYQKGKYKVLFAHPQSAGHGLTLTRATATIWASPSYNLEHFLQGLKRIHRIGQTEKTETIVVVAKGTYDEKAWLVCNKKDAKQKDFLEMIE